MNKMIFYNNEHVHYQYGGNRYGVAGDKYIENQYIGIHNWRICSYSKYLIIYKYNITDVITIYNFINNNWTKLVSVKLPNARIYFAIMNDNQIIYSSIEIINSQVEKILAGQEIKPIPQLGVFA